MITCQTFEKYFCFGQFSSWYTFQGQLKMSSWQPINKTLEKLALSLVLLLNPLSTPMWLHSVRRLQGNSCLELSNKIVFCIHVYNTQCTTESIFLIFLLFIIEKIIEYFLLKKHFLVSINVLSFVSWMKVVQRFFFF